jgi:hypothetical protein
MAPSAARVRALLERAAGTALVGASTAQVNEYAEQVETACNGLGRMLDLVELQLCIWAAGLAAALAPLVTALEAPCSSGQPGVPPLGVPLRIAWPGAHGPGGPAGGGEAARQPSSRAAGQPARPGSRPASWQAGAPRARPSGGLVQAALAILGLLLTKARPSHPLLAHHTLLIDHGFPAVLLAVYQLIRACVLHPEGCGDTEELRGMEVRAAARCGVWGKDLGHRRKGFVIQKVGFSCCTSRAPCGHQDR